MIKNSFSSLKNLASQARHKMYSTVARGSPHSADFRLFFKNHEGKIISPFHDIPLLANPGGSEGQATLYNMIVEIPRWTQAKMEIATNESFNPIKQDEKNGKLRYVHNCFPYHGYIWNYGALPQTWENPSFLDPHTNAKGDNDPIDVCEIGSKVLERGQVVPVKVLGVMALIDDGETDWKLIVIRADDPLANTLNDIDDVETKLPGLLKATHEWFKIYKIPDGKPPNKFAFDGKAKGADFAKKIINETHDQWKEMIKKSDPGKLKLKNVLVDNSPHKVSFQESEDCLKSQPELTQPKSFTQEEKDSISALHYVVSQ